MTRTLTAGPRLDHLDTHDARCAAALVTATLDALGLTWAALMAPSRDSYTVDARRYLIVVLSEDVGLTSTEIGKLLGGMDHSTVIHHLGVMRKRAGDVDTQLVLEDIRREAGRTLNGTFSYRQRRAWERRYRKFFRKYGQHTPFVRSWLVARQGQQATAQRVSA